MNGNRDTWITKWVAWSAGSIAGIWTGMPAAMHILVYVMFADVLTGLCRAGMQGQWNSHCSFRGMMRKSAMLIVAALGVVLDRHIRPTPNLGAVLAMAFTAVEGISIGENLRAMGVPMPRPFAELFTNMRKMTDIVEEKSDA